MEGEHCKHCKHSKHSIQPQYIHIPSVAASLDSSTHVTLLEAHHCPLPVHYSALRAYFGCGCS